MTTSHSRGSGGWRARSTDTLRQQPSCRGIGATDIEAFDWRHGLRVKGRTDPGIDEQHVGQSFGDLTNGRPSSKMPNGDRVFACASVERD